MTFEVWGEDLEKRGREFAYLDIDIMYKDWKAEREKLIGVLEKYGHRKHYYCEDCWYSCPKAEDGCCNDLIDKNKCNCGADEINVAIDAALAKVKEKGG